MVQSSRKTHWNSRPYSWETFPRIIPRVTAIKSSPTKPPLSLTWARTFPSSRAWNCPTIFGTIPPWGSDNLSDRRTMFWRMTGGAEERMSRTATHVSSQDVSIPSTVNERLNCLDVCIRRTGKHPDERRSIPKNGNSHVKPWLIVLCKSTVRIKSIGAFCKLRLKGS
jgi:hypothetical protein